MQCTMLVFRRQLQWSFILLSFGESMFSVMLEGGRWRSDASVRVPMAASDFL
jgi:hypothetical protein